MGDYAQAPPDLARPGRQRKPGHGGAPERRLGQRGEDAQEGGLACPVGTEQDHKLAGSHVEVNAAENRLEAEIFSERAGFNHSHTFINLAFSRRRSFSYSRSSRLPASNSSSSSATACSSSSLLMVTSASTWLRRYHQTPAPNRTRATAPMPTARFVVSPTTTPAGAAAEPGRPDISKASTSPAAKFWWVKLWKGLPSNSCCPSYVSPSPLHFTSTSETSRFAASTRERRS